MDIEEDLDEQTSSLLDSLKSVFEYLKKKIIENKNKKMHSNFEAYIDWITRKIDLELHSQKSEVKQMKITQPLDISTSSSTSSSVSVDVSVLFAKLPV